MSFLFSIYSYNSWLWVEICPAVKRKRPHSLEFNSIWTRHGLTTPAQRISLRLTTMMNRRKTGSLGYVHFNGSLTLQETDSGTDPYSDSKLDGYIVLCRTCSHCTDSDFDAYSLFLYRTGIQVLVNTWVCPCQWKWAITLTTLPFTIGTKIWKYPVSTANHEIVTQQKKNNKMLNKHENIILNHLNQMELIMCCIVSV